MSRKYQPKHAENMQRPSRNRQRHKTSKSSAQRWDTGINSTVLYILCPLSGNQKVANRVNAGLRAVKRQGFSAQPNLINILDGWCCLAFTLDQGRETSWRYNGSKSTLHPALWFAHSQHKRKTKKRRLFASDEESLHILGDGKRWMAVKDLYAEDSTTLTQLGEK